MAVKYVSNEIDDFEQGGLYPGGTGIFESIKYTLWDYDGNQPKDSAIAVHVKFQPTDGSNEGKPVDIYWSAGNAADFAPDPTGGFLVPLKAREKQSDNSNWAHVLKRFKDNCGLEKGKLSGPTGILALERSEVTLTRIDQPKREGLNEDKPAEGDKKQTRGKTFLAPTKARFPWEKGGAGTRAAAPKTNPTPAPTETATPSSNGAAGSTDLSVVIKDLVTSKGGSIMFAELPKELLGVLADVDRSERTNLIKQAKDVKFIENLATENSWTFDGKELII